MRNFFSDIHKAYHGWHRDCGGEKNYSFCLNILKEKDYIFGKIGVYLRKY